MRLALPPARPGHRGEGNEPDARWLGSPDTRARTVGYLATAQVAAPGFRTDGVWVWPESLAVRARLAEQAPPLEFLEHLRMSRFLLPNEVPDELLDQATALAYGPLARAFAATDEPGPLAVARRTTRPLLTDLSGQSIGGVPPGTAPRLARLFDAVTPVGTGRWTPDRLRVPEPLRRERLARYLDGGRLVLRAPGDVPDPLDPTQRLPLHYRTDGAWVWPEALAHYLRARGVAPELDLLCHIEERGYQLPDVAADTVLAARAAIRPLVPTPTTAPSTYLSGAGGELIRVRGPAPGRVEMLREDLRWGPPPRPIDPVDRALGFRVIDEEQAVAEIEGRWATGRPTPPLN